MTITGVSLTQTTTVTLGGKTAAFTVNSDTQGTTTVPTGAKTGKIAIATAGGAEPSKEVWAIQRTPGKNRNSALLIDQSVRVVYNPTRERGMHFGPLLEVIKTDVDPSHPPDSK